VTRTVVRRTLVDFCELTDDPAASETSSLASSASQKLKRLQPERVWVPTLVRSDWRLCKHRHDRSWDTDRKPMLGIRFACFHRANMEFDTLGNRRHPKYRVHGRNAEPNECAA
jgi:hypothetical protein